MKLIEKIVTAIDVDLADLFPLPIYFSGIL